ncbi:Cytosolic sulfotransferase 15 [Sesamum alatum]|uniref:Sulfotransferase n=1 Tax=Sesamum alatum TaxID=300844 RepID=A0AAE2CHL6_9LAMI|nr:Cytosolic sulfotransferase 15 [Sesamum alatum]
MENKENPKDDLHELLQTLERHVSPPVVKYGGFWLPQKVFRQILSTQKNFKAQGTDVILSTLPKSGTTWLKALTFSIANRHLFTIDQSPLLTSSPHTLVPFLEFNVYWEQENPDLSNVPSPRIFATHMPFELLPDSIRESDCRLIYMCRNPLDQFVSYCNFSPKESSEPVPIDEYFDMFCQGIHMLGPFWDHMLGYWNAHLENPRKVLFLSFESLSNLAPNKTGSVNGIVKNSSFFRKGQVGDWTNYLTPAMAARIKKLMDSKFEGSSLMYNT